jgi:ATP-binding cassette subfamily B protein/subfamily B ATP-binding cassette protein MsbA
MTSWWRHLLGYAGPHAKQLTVILGAMFVIVGLEALRPWPLKLLVDGVFASSGTGELPAALRQLPGAGTDAGLVAWLAGATLLLFLALQIMRIAQGYLQTGVGNRMVFELGADLFEHLQRLSLTYHHKTPRGDLVRRITMDTRCVRGLVMGVALPVATSLVTVGVMFWVMLELDPLLAVVAVGAAGPLVWVVRWRAAPLAEREWRYQEAEAAVISHAERILGALPVIKVFRGENREERGFRELGSQSVTAYQRSIGQQLLFQFSTQAVTALGAAAIMVIGGMHVLQGRLELGSLLVFLAYLASLYAPMETLAYLSSGFASAAANARRVFSVLENTEGVKDRPGARALASVGKHPKGRVTFDAVSFGYGAAAPVLSDIDLDVRAGEHLAIVGPTGAGKTTLVSLVARLYDPTSGCISIDGMDLRDVTLPSLRANVALVLQEPFLLHGTVAENIAYADPDATRERIEAASRAADAHAFVSALPRGYDTEIGERGATLSLGQRQRLSIARAFLKNAPVLILDEPTSALDSGSEATLVRALEHLQQGRTTFIIAHRLSTIRAADRIIFLEGGRIIESGTHSELMARRGAYHAFYGLQHRETELTSVSAALELTP